MTKIQITMTEEQAKEYLELPDYKKIQKSIDEALLQVLDENQECFVDECSGIKVERIKE